MNFEKGFRFAGPFAEEHYMKINKSKNTGVFSLYLAIDSTRFHESRFDVLEHLVATYCGDHMIFRSPSDARALYRSLLAKGYKRTMAEAREAYTAA